MFTLRDCETKEIIEFPDDTVCVCCGAKNDLSHRGTRLVIDHDRWVKPFQTRVLCFTCNLKKGSKAFVSFPDHIWKPGMGVGEKVPKPKVELVRTFYNDRNKRTSEAMKRWWKRRKSEAGAIR